MAETVEQKLTALVDRLKPAFGDKLVSAILYGSAAAGDYYERASDLNILCVLSQLTPHELVQSEPVFRWWRELGNPSPLLLTEEEVASSSDSFPMEFHDMQEHRRVLHGKDVIGDLVIDRSFYRAQVEHELRAKVIRLRQKAAEVLANADRLTKLMTDSVSTFCVLGRHALILSGAPPKWKKTEIVAALEDALRMSFAATSEVLTIRAAAPAKAPQNAGSIFTSYLKEMYSLVQFVDGLDR
jgi:predicted nucleotidyltransferase